MGFDLWLDGQVAWARGTCEYRPLGVAVIAATDLFRGRDFRARLRLPALEPRKYLGQFASIGDLNAHLERRRRVLDRSLRSRLGF